MHTAVKVRMEELELYKKLLTTATKSDLTFREGVGHGWRDVTQETLARYRSKIAFLSSWIVKNKDFYAS